MNPCIDSACAPLGPRDTSDDIKEALFEPRGGEFSFPTTHKNQNITYSKGNIFSFRACQSAPGYPNGYGYPLKICPILDTHTLPSTPQAGTR